MKEIPYSKDHSQCNNISKKLKTYHVVEWCDLICVYFHADDKSPEFELPDFTPKELKSGNWCKHLNWNVGYTTLNTVDWVDQTSDHSHFQTLHKDMLIPWTVIPIPKWLLYWFPLGICHTVTTFKGNIELFRLVIG